MNNRNLIITVVGLLGACVCGACLAAFAGFALYGQQISSLLATPTPTLLPTAVATATPTPPVNVPRTTPTLPGSRGTPTPSARSDTTVVFTDNFAGACNLLEGDDAQRALKCENGTYTMLNKTTNSRWVYYSDEYPDIVIEADARAVSGPTFIEYGIVFRIAKDGKSFHGFTLTREGKFTVFRYKDAVFTDLISYTSNSAVKTGTATNRLKVVAQGNQIAVYANDQWLNTVTDSTFQNGTVGFFINNSDPNAKVAFSNLKVSQLNNRLVLPRGVPTMTPTPPR